MDFKENRPIYIQIGERICDQILHAAWQPNERIPSVREMGGALEVNPNTVMRSYEWLAERGIIYNKRGIGFFVSDSAVEVIGEQERTRLMEVELKAISERIALLQIPLEVVVERLQYHLEGLSHLCASGKTGSAESTPPLGENPH